MAYPRKWEYDADDNLSVDASAEEIVEHLDAMGGEGWELVAIQKQDSLYRCVYKRPLQGGDDHEDDDYNDDYYEDDDDYNEDDYDEDGTIRVNPPPPEAPRGFWGR